MAFDLGIVTHVYNSHMFDTEKVMASHLSEWTVDESEQCLLDTEAQIGWLRAQQLRHLRRLDLAQIASLDGARSLHEWTAARLDVTPETARDLITAARSIPDDVEDELSQGDVTFDRAVATTRLAATGASQEVVDAARGHDLSGVQRLTAAHRRMEPGEQHEGFDSRHAAVQLSLDQTSANVWATLTGVDCEIVTQALDQWADSLPKLPDGTRDSRAHRQADAFVAIFRHALGEDSESGTTSGRGPHVLLTADLATLAQSGGTKGLTVVGGPRVGINALEEALCNGSVSLDVTLEDGRILGLGNDTDAIPPRGTPIRSGPRRWLHRRRLPQPAPATGPPHHPPFAGRHPRPPKPHHSLLVAPSCCHPRQGILDRSRQPTAASPLQTTRSRPTLTIPVCSDPRHPPPPQPSRRQPESDRATGAPMRMAPALVSPILSTRPPLSDAARERLGQRQRQQTVRVDCSDCVTGTPQRTKTRRS